MQGHGVLAGKGEVANLSSGWNQRHCDYLEWYNNGTDEYIYVINWEGDYIYYYTPSGSGAAPGQVTDEKLCAQKATYYVYFNGSYVTEMLTPYP